MFTIRLFEPADEPAVITLWEQCQLTRPQNNSYLDITRKLHHSPRLFLVGVLDHQIIATVMAGYEGHRGWINYLAVDPHQQKQGFGRVILAEAEQQLAKLGCPKINLQVRTSNQEVLNFYQQMGYQVEELYSLGKRLAPPEFHPLPTPRLVLRNFGYPDLPAFTAYRADPAVAQYQSWENYTPADAEQFFAEQKLTTFNTPGSWYQIAWALKENNQIIGDCGLHFLEDGAQVEIGYTLATAYQRQGYAREAVSAVLQFLFTKLNKHRVMAITDVLNTPSIHLLERLGFRREAHHQKNIWFKGAWGDEFVYALLREEWIDHLNK
jgi:RimJ/RimL family protein N-acetyltransferase